MNENRKINKKKLLFSAYSLGIGGIETSLLNLVNYLSNQNYDITIVLEEKTGELLEELNKDIKVIEYKPSYNKLFGKIINAKKRVEFIKKYKNKFDASFAYATYCKMASFTARVASNNSSLWVHSSYLDMFENDEKKYFDFFKGVNVDDFKNIIFVSQRSKDEFERIFHKSNTLVCNNIIDYRKITKQSEENIDIEKYNDNIYTFLYVGRITEESKKVSRIIETARILKEQKLQFKILVIGDGKDLDKLKESTIANGLENNILFLGKIKNPYPYFKIADSLLLLSENEGYPVVFNEAKVLKLPIITTDVSDSKIDIEGKYGVVCSQKVEEIADTMKLAINSNGDIFNKQSMNFNPESYNSEIAKILENIINERN